MKRQTHNRILSFFLCAVVTITVLLLCVFAVTNEEFAVTLDGEKVEQVIFSQDEKKEVSLQGVPTDAELQWQIRMPDGEGWVNISGQVEDTLTLSYALIANIMDQTGRTAVRCAATVSGEEIVTAPVEVQMSFIIDSSLSQAPADTQQNTESGGVILLAATTYVEVRIEYVDEYGNKMFDPYIAYLESGTPFEATVKSPSRLGYGAYTDGTVRDEHLGYPNKKPDALSVTLNYASVTENKTVRVVYFKIPVKYTVRYFLQNVNNDLYTENPNLYFIGEALEGDYPKDSIEIDIAGFTPLYHQPADIAADGSTEFEVRYDRNYYLINFKLEGGFGVEPIYARYETHIVAPTPVKPGYVFGGWELVSYEEADGTKVNVATDGNPEPLPTAMPSRNETWQAIWNTVDTTYTVAYWIRNPDGTRSYLGNRVASETSANTVSGEDDLGKTDDQGNLIYHICGVQEHTHTGDCYKCGDASHDHSADCYRCNQQEHTHNSDCPVKCGGHTHTLDCYPVVQGAEVTGQDDLAAINAANATEPDPDTVYFYFIQATWDQGADQYWCKVCIGGEYFTGYINNSEMVYTRSTLDSLGEYVSEGKSGARTAYKFKAYTDCDGHHTSECFDCDIPAHTHGSNCVLCGKREHSHAGSCYQSTRHMSFVEADQNVLIEGDGSSVVNVYYEYKEYTLKFYYAASTSTTTGDAISTTYLIVGGTSYYFGGQHDGVGNYNDYLTSSTADMLDRMFDQGIDRVGRTESGSVPSLNAEGERRVKEGIYTKGKEYDKESGRTYYFISFTARYGDDISEKWPIDVFQSVTMAEGYTTTNGATGDWKTNRLATVSAWNGEHHVYYSKHTKNETIKGKYEKLDYTLLYDSAFEDSLTVSYLCFWENGAKANWNVPRLFRYNIWVEADASELTADKMHIDGKTPTKTVDGITYKRIDVYDTCDDSNLAGQTQPALTGYTAKSRAKRDLTASTDAEELKDIEHYYDSRIYASGMAVDFYYTANRHKLVFWNYHDFLTDGSGATLKYNTPLSVYGEYVDTDYMNEHYPDVLEPDAYLFRGWYTTADCYPGTEVVWTGKMPDTDVTVYAKWEPVEREVKFYYTFDDLKNDNQWADQTPIKVPHGEILSTGSVKEPTREGYTFVGWFYIDETGEKKAFSLYEMEVRQDLKLYAEWHSEIRTEYIVYYKIQGTNTSIALPDQEYIFAGLTKTFVAKAGTDLFPAYQGANAEGKMYFPVTNSHSILMYPYEIADDGTDVIPQNNKYTFEYIFIAVPNYTVKYVDAQTGLPVAPEKTVLGAEHKAAVVTEQFVHVDNYLPDSAHKRLVLSANEDENVITFYYTKQNTDEPGDSGSGTPTPPGKTYYKVTHYIQNLDGTTYSEYTSYEKIGEFGTTVEAEYLTIAGFEAYEGHTDTVKKAVLTKPTDENGDGIVEDYKIVELKLYYNRLSYPYEVRYLDNTTQKPVSPTKYSVGNLPYGTSVTETAIELSGYNLVGSVTKEIIIGDKVQETDAEGNKHYNIITFYYSEKKADIFYHAVCTSPVATNFGHVSPSLEAQVTSSNIQGSTATAYSGFRFVGWFEDSTCVTPVPETWVGGTKIVPQIDMQNMEGSYSFYALFEPIPTDLTIKKTGVADDCTDNFIFHVQGVAGTVTEHVDLYITINGNGSVVIPDVYCGLYIITELRWSYQYKPDQTEKNVTVLEDPTKNVVTFKNDYIGSDWLGGEDSLDNEFTGVYTPSGT